MVLIFNSFEQFIHDMITFFTYVCCRIIFSQISMSVQRMAAHVTRMQTVRTMRDRTLVPAKMVLLEMEQCVLVNCILVACALYISPILFVRVFVYLFVYLFISSASRLVDLG